MIKMSPMSSISSVSSSMAPAASKKVAFGNSVSEPASDVVDVSNSGKVQPPHISRVRLMFNRLTKEQIAQVNAAGQLPENAKFEMLTGTYTVANNWMNVTSGTRTIPAGYELKQDIFGFTIVVPKDTKGLFIKD